MLVMQTLVYIYGFILLMSSVFTFFLYMAYREKLLKSLLYFWLSGILCFVMQGVFSQPNEIGFLAFTTNTLSLFLLLKIYHALFETQLSSKIYFGLTGAGAVISLGAMFLGVEYGAASSFYCVGIFLATMVSLFQNRKGNVDLMRKGFSILIFLNGAHFIDYPFIRSNPEMAVLGFSIVLSFYFIYSIYIPLFVIKKTSDSYSMSLEKQVLARTSQLNLAYEHLMESNKNLGILTKENQMLLSILVHDISNPVQIIMAFVDRASKVEVENFPHNLKSKARTALGTILDTLATVKNFHTVRMGKITPRLSEFDIKDVIASVIDQFEEKISMKNLSVNLVVCPDTETLVNSDRAWIKNQIFSNILSNAIKFSYVDGKIEINVSSARNGLFIRVRDFGAGVSSEAKSKIFSSSSVTSTLGTHGEKGTGLGMPIVKEYVTRLNGTVEIIDVPTGEVGTCFQLYFPKKFIPENNTQAA
ncbi:MAG: HAMP domain-containing histidine kinase [Bdellovibrionaceae bacterium]|nr:HAMP domain-containing histidine kinase [Pseudobdellovibrionaceae bacterium]